MKCFKTGDHVKITAGKKFGVTGMVLRVDQQIVYATILTRIPPLPDRHSLSAEGGTEGTWPRCVAAIIE
jgi:hypothetical protein